MQYRRHDELTWDDAGDLTVILDPKGSVLVTLNGVGSLLWRRLDRPLDAERLMEILAETFPDVGTAQLRTDVEQFLESLVAAGLVVAEAQGT